MKKAQAFEYLLYKMIAVAASSSQCDRDAIVGGFTRLKALKLLFFASTVGLLKNINDSTHKNDLLDIFNNFYAMQHGPVESDIYRCMSEDSFKHFDFSQRATRLKTSWNEMSTAFQISCDSGLLKRIDDSVDCLVEKNPNIFTYEASRLVNISHKWIVWRRAYAFAELIGKRSEKMNMNDITTGINLIFE